jgi:hypothetical protein
MTFAHDHRNVLFGREVDLTAAPQATVLAGDRVVHTRVGAVDAEVIVPSFYAVGFLVSVSLLSTAGGALLIKDDLGVLHATVTTVRTAVSLLVTPQGVIIHSTAANPSPPTSGVQWIEHAGPPDGVLAHPAGTMCRDTNSGVTWQKTTPATTTTGWEIAY